MSNQSPAVGSMNEVGGRLRADELDEGAVVCVRREGRSFAVTLSIVQVTEATVSFLAGAVSPPMVFVALRLPDGTIVDGSGEEILVYEFLGEI